MPREAEQVPAEVSSPPRGWPPNFIVGGADRDALLVLAHLDGITPRRRHALAWWKGSARRCLAAARAGAAGGADGAPAEVSPDRVRSSLAASRARHVCPGDEEYPAALLDLPDPPASLFVRGKSLSALGHAVSIVGARRPSTYGREAADILGRGLASAGVTVVSGAALGIDAAAHVGALAACGPTARGTRPDQGPSVVPTVAVLGSGIDRPHPARNRGLIEEIAAVGAVVSEYPPGAPALPWRFPARNRLVAALSRAVVVVEGATGSGSLITAEFALEMGRDVLAVPGPVTSPLSSVPHQLIREGAWLARGPEDVLEVLGLESSAPAGGTSGDVPGGARGGSLSPVERRALDVVAGSPITVDAVAAEARLSVAEALSVLVALELRGLVREVGGRYERRAVRSP